MATAIENLKVEASDVQSCVKKLAIEIPEDNLNREYDKAINQVKKSVSIQGFRKGKAPKEVVEKMYRDSILWDVGQKLISSGFEQAINNENLKIYGDPAFEEVKLEPGQPVTFSATVETIPDVEIPDMSGWEFTREVEKTDPEKVEGPIKQTLEQHAELAPVEDRAVQDGDWVILDYEGSIDGEKDDRLSGQNAEVMINSHDANVLVEFHQQIVGMKPDEEKEFTVTLSKQFPDPALAEKDVNFKTKVHTIKEKRLPELNDEFVAANTPYGSLEEMRKELTDRAEQQAKYMADEGLKTKVMDKLIEETSFDLPPKMLEQYIQMYESRIRERARYSGQELEQTPGFDKQQFEESCRQQGERMAREEVLIGAIADKEQVQPDPKEVQEVQQSYMQILKQAGDESDEGRRKAINLAVKEVVTGSVYKFLLDKVKIEDKTVENAEENK